MRVSQRYLSPTFLLIAVVTVGCGRDSTAPEIAKTGAIEITVSTTSTIGQVDTTGYMVRIDDDVWRAVGVPTRVRIDGVSRAMHRVTLSGLAANCYVAQDNPMLVNVDPELGTLLVTFSVNCSPSGPDPWGY